jgi:hypothetical protein
MKKFAAALMAVACGACVDDGLDEDLELGEVEQAFTWAQSHRLDSYLNDDVDRTIAPLNQSCFLIGVGGNLSSSWQNMLYDGTTTAWAGVRNEGSAWGLRARTGYPFATRVRAEGMCINSAAGRIGPFSWRSTTDPADKQVASASPKRACFLTTVRNDDWYSDNEKWTSNNDGAWIYKHANGTWHMAGTGQAYATAYCMDITEPMGEWFYYGYQDVNLMQNTTGDVQCFLTGLTGGFRSNNVDLGASAYYANGWWKLRVNTGRGARVACVR